MSLEDVFAKYGVPDPSIVQHVDKNGVSLAYVSHAQITKALCEIDPNWTWEPALGADGLPAIRIQHGEIRRRDKPPIPIDMATMWGRLTLCGVTRWAVGSVEAHKPDLDKELVSDFLRNAAMRFGVALGLWMKDGGDPAPPSTQRYTTSRPLSGGYKPVKASDKQKNLIRVLSKQVGRPVPASIDEYDTVQASEVIDQLKKAQAEQPADEEEPF